MTDTWNELWGEISIDGITQTSNISNSWVRNILNRIKAEGNNLKAKADMLDRIEEMGVVTVYDDRHWSTDYNTLKDKLEAIKIYLQTPARSSDSSLTICIGVLSILKGEALKSIGDKAQ